MITLLVVDDEKYAVRGITEGIEWSDTPIGRIREAFDAESAKEAMQAEPVDIVICDIEMPGESGLELIEWMNERYPHTETIFLTGHAKFSYAQKAMQLGGYRYMLKPAEFGELKRTVCEAADRIIRERELMNFRETYRKYFLMWENQKPLLVERFWQDVLNERFPSIPDRLETALKLYEIPLSPEGKLLPVLISVEQWDQEFNARDEEIMEYAVRKAAAETVLRDWNGTVIQDRGGISLMLLYLNGGEEPDDGQLKQRCEDYIRSCNQFFHCKLSCYIGGPVPIRKLHEAFQALLETESGNVGRRNDVIDKVEPAVSEGSRQPVPLPPFEIWTDMLENGRMEELKGQASDFFELLERNPHPESLEAFYYGWIGSLYRAAFRRGGKLLPLLESGGLELYGQTPPTRSAGQLRLWTERLLERLMYHLRANGPVESSVVSRIKEYVSAHIGEEMNREQIAAAVFLNPAYVSRLFRKETGESLTEYVSKLKVEKARKLLAETNFKISSVAEEVGYSHFSHFAKVFKRVTGLTPQEFRRSFQRIES